MEWHVVHRCFLQGGALRDRVHDFAIAGINADVTYQEAIHSQSYGYMLDTICNPSERNDILYQWIDDEHLLARNSFIGGLYNDFQKNQNPYTIEDRKSVV